MTARDDNGGKSKVIFVLAGILYGLVIGIASWTLITVLDMKERVVRLEAQSPAQMEARLRALEQWKEIQEDRFRR